MADPCPCIVALFEIALVVFVDGNDGDDVTADDRRRSSLCESGGSDDDGRNVDLVVDVVVVVVDAAAMADRGIFDVGVDLALASTVAAAFRRRDDADIVVIGFSLSHSLVWNRRIMEEWPLRAAGAG